MTTDDATCTAEGQNHYTATFTESWATTQTYDYTLEALGHKWCEPTYTWNEDNTVCTATRVCTNDNSHTEIATATMSTENTTLPTCLGEGVDTITASFEESWAITQTKTVIVDALGHNWGRPYTSQWLTNEDKQGQIQIRQCKNCHIDDWAIASTVTYIITTPATCTTEGAAYYYATYYNREDWLNESARHFDVTIPALGHEWSEPTYTWNEDYSECTATRTCLHDASHTDIATATISVAHTAPTCTTAGKDVCTATFENWSVSTYVIFILPELGHDWEETYTWNEDNTECTATRVCKNDASHTDTATATINVAHTVPSCEAAGYDTLTASFEEEWATEQIKTVDYEAGHRINDFGVCIVCNEDFTETPAFDTTIHFLAVAKYYKFTTGAEMTKVKITVTPASSFNVKVVDSNGNVIARDANNICHVLPNSTYYISIKVVSLEACDWRISDATNYVMGIKSSDFITGKGATVTGVLSEDVALRDKVYYYSIASGKYEETTIVGIGMNNILLENASAGDSVTLILRGVSSGDVLIAYPLLFSIDE